MGNGVDGEASFFFLFLMFSNECFFGEKRNRIYEWEKILDWKRKCSYDFCYHFEIELFCDINFIFYPNSKNRLFNNETCSLIAMIFISIGKI